MVQKRNCLHPYLHSHFKDFYFTLYLSLHAYWHFMYAPAIQVCFCCLFSSPPSWSLDGPTERNQRSKDRRLSQNRCIFRSLVEMSLSFLSLMTQMIEGHSAWIWCISFWMFTFVADQFSAQKQNRSNLPFWKTSLKVNGTQFVYKNTKTKKAHEITQCDPHQQDSGYYRCLNWKWRLDIILGTRICGPKSKDSPHPNLFLNFEVSNFSFCFCSKMVELLLGETSPSFHFLFLNCLQISMPG